MKPTGDHLAHPGTPPGTGGKKESGDRDAGRKSYQSPRLECYGKLSEVTQFGGSQQVDSGSLGPQPLAPPSLG
ncbi:MAG TPA: hypothetical protein VMT85_02585 [Thermoanaerobaculia bacterium]|nr:hypothetical protein [Thermoanaerobaculia bacterium]